jgi:hypothetical protein
MRFNSFIALLTVALISTASAQTQYTSTQAAAVEAARATARTLSPTSSVRGKTFDRFVNIWLENPDFDMAAGDRATLSSYSPTIANVDSVSAMDRTTGDNPYQLPRDYTPKST